MTSTILPPGPPNPSNSESTQRARTHSSALPLLGILAGAGLAYLLLRRTSDPEVDAIHEYGDELERAGALVLRDAKGSARPPTIEGRIPDLFALFSDGSQIAIEFENDRSVDGWHARTQHRAFKRWASRSPKRHYEQVVVRGGRGGRR